MEPKRLLLDRVSELAMTRPDHPAMIHVVGGRTITWAELHDENLRWASVYRSLGVQPGQTVVSMLRNSFEAYFAWLGAAWLRAIEAPCNSMFLGQTLEYLINNSQASLLVIAEEFVDRLASIAANLPLLERVVVLGDQDSTAPSDRQPLPFEVFDGDALLAASEPARDLQLPEPWDIAAMIYTSGTTGPSKGVLAPWAEFAETPAILPDDFIGEGEPSYVMYPPFHLSGKTSLVAAVDRGAYIVMRERFSASQFWDDMRTYGCTSASLNGPIVNMLLAAPPSPDDLDNPLERILSAPLTPILDTFKERFGVKHVCTGYGMSEIGTPIVSGWDPPLNGTCGRPRVDGPGYEVRLVDEHDQVVPTGTPGEMIIRASRPWVLNAGYWNMPEQTATAWRNGWFHTGDAFVQDEDGWLFFVDRMKDALRRRGENISSFEVEAGLLAHPSVAEAAVIGVPSELGEDEVMAFIVVRPDSSLTPEELIEFLGPRMPYFMIPRYVDLVDSLPTTDGMYRVRKTELRERGVTATTWDRGPTDSQGVRK